MPLVSKTFDQLLDFTRTSAATFVGSNGLVQTTPASVNLLLETQQFDGPNWPKNSSTITANSTVAPDGTSTADTINAIAAVSGGPRVYQRPAITGGTAYTISSYFKASGTNFAFLSMRTNSVNWAGAEFNLSTGTVSRNAVSGNVAYVGATISDAGNGWYRCAVTVTPTDTIAANLGFIFFGSSDGTSAFVGGFPVFTNVGTESIFIWGAQLELGSAATTYTRNNGGVFPPRFDYGPVTLAAKGLLIEEQRTNLLTYSEQFDNAAWTKTDATVTANATTSPDGTQTSDTFTDTTANTGHLAFESVSTITSGTTYTLSVFAKASTATVIQVLGRSGTMGANVWANFNLSNGTIGSVGSSTTASITDFGGGWYRCIVTGTATGTGTGAFALSLTNNSTTALRSPTYIGTGTGTFIWGAQLEVGAFATSYIPTVASQVTRTADQCSIVAPNFAPWYNQSEGTFVASYNSVAPASRYAINANDGTSSNLIGIEFSSAETVRGRITTAGVSQASMGAGSAISANAVVNAGLAYATNSAITASGGVLSTEDTSVTLATLTQLNIGAILTSTFLNGHIRSIQYYPVRLSNAQLQALTA